MTIGFNCPRCGSPSTRARRSDNVRANARREKAGHGILNYCCDCKLAWWLKLDPLGLDATSNNMTDDDDDDDDVVEELLMVESSGFAASSSARPNRNVLCANCDKVIAAQDASFLCSQNCGRSFHIECVRDPLVETLSCRACLESGRARQREEVRGAFDIGSLQSVKDTLDGFVGHGTDDLQIPVKDFLWPDSCEARVDADYDKSDPTDGLTQEIQTAWQQCVLQLTEHQRSQSSTILDTLTSNNLKKISSDFLDKMLQKMFEFRASMPNRPLHLAKKVGPRTSWLQVINAAKSLNVDSGIIFQAEKAFLDAVAKDPSPNGDLEQWSVDEVAQFLRWCQLPQLESAFRQNQVDGKCLSSLTWEDLKDDLEVESDLEIHLLLDQVNLMKTHSA